MNLITELVIANRILAKEDVVDAYGHVSVRNPEAPERFFLAHSKSPALVEPGDIVEHTLDGQSYKTEPRPLYLERFIHAAIYEARPVAAVAAVAAGWAWALASRLASSALARG